ncbi:MAG: trypsin-like serine protease [Myxococcales bacterium]|nr:trypsin-like serine protease [Myxococcales bacterium]USN50264.1 MAG: trypsin-like serine protease [Myxococcales bacterium]
MQLIRLIGLLFFCGLSASFSSYAVVFHSLGEHQEHLELAKKFPSVGKLRLNFRNKDATRLIETHCTGTLIDPLTVITLAQCVDPVLIKEEGFEFDRNTNYFRANTFALGDDVLNEPIAVRSVKGAVLFAGHKQDNELTQAQNLALIYLESPIYNVEPAQLYEEDISRSFRKKKVVMVGFGFYGEPWNPYKEDNTAAASNKEIDFHKRACWQELKDFRRSVLETHFSIESEDYFGMFTHGDQGGPLFIERDGHWYLLGINSHRINPSFDDKDKKIDERDILYGTKGISLAIPSYLGWIRDNQALRTLTRSITLDNSEWTFGAYWNKGIFPHNNLQESLLYEAIVNKPGIIIFDNFISLEKLSLENANAKLFIPYKLPLALKRQEIDEHIQKLFENGKKFEAVEYERGIIEIPGSEDISRALKIESREIIINAGVVDIDGELWFENFKLHGGKLMGTGALVYSTSPIVNTNGVVMPGKESSIGTLRMVGDYVQHSPNEESKGGILHIRAQKKRKKIENSVLHVQGHAQLGGTLVIEEMGNAFRHGDKIKFLYGKNSGKFSDCKLPAGFLGNIEYNQDSVSITLKDPLWQKDIKLNEFSSLSLEHSTSPSSLLINGGSLRAGAMINLGDGALVMHSGELSMSQELPQQTLVLNGNYEQSGGTLKLMIKKTLVEIQDEKEYIVNPDGSLILAEDVPFDEDKKRVVQKIGNPEFVWTTDNIKVSGTAILGGHLEIRFESDELLVKEGTEVSVVKAHKIEGAFASVTKLPGMIQPKLVYTPQEVILRFEKQGSLSELNFKSEEAKTAALILEQQRDNKKYSSLFLKLGTMNEDDIEVYLLNMVIKTPGYQRLLGEYTKSHI